jgi:restriction system protein
MVRAGRMGQREETALREGLVIVGWPELDDLTPCRTRDELRERVAQAYPEASRARIGNWTGQLWRIRGLMEVGDLVVTPLKTHHDQIAIGRIAGPYRYRTDAPSGFQHVRDVEWLRQVKRSNIQQDLLDSLGSLLTVCEIKRYGAVRRLAQVVAGGVDPGAATSDAAALGDTPRELMAAAAAADAGQPLTLTIRELINRWGFARRTAQVVARIESDLADAGLTTRPAFSEGWIGNRIALIQVGEEPGSGVPVVDPVQAVGDATEADVKKLTLRVGDLPSANAGVVFVRAGQPLAAATTKMVAKNYSQLAVLAEDDTVVGSVSWESIGKAHLSHKHVDLVAATTPPRTVGYHDDLLGQIGDIFTHNFVFVRAADGGVLSGIVTAADLTQRFGVTASPFILMEEAELRLRRRVDDTIDIETIRASAKNKKKVSSAADLSLGDYKYLLTEENFALLDWPLDREVFIEQLEKVRLLRNDLMHFSPDPPDEEALSDLQGFVDLLRLVNAAQEAG